MNLTQYCNKIIEYSFYTLFFLVPLLFSQYTSELFELNKMWATYGLAIIIFSAWATKMIASGQFRIQRTILDIPLLLFLLSQIISTLFSMDQRISFFGYYSRFNGGLLSIITYIFLFYAFVSNSSLKQTWRSLSVSLLGGTLVALWGFPSHFGYDPTCLLFRGTFDTSCWTDAFHPTVRIFSTLGQPAWLAAYLAMLIPLATAYMLRYDREGKNKNLLWYSAFFLLVLLFYADLLFANTRAGFLGFLFAYLLFWMILWIKNLTKKEHGQKVLILVAYILANIGLLFATIRTSGLIASISTIGFLLLLFSIKRYYKQTFLLVNIALLVLSLIFSTPLGSIQDTLRNLTPSQSTTTTQQKAEIPQAGTVLDTNITDSGNIRKIVWKGGLDMWKAHPVFGTGVETYAFAYYAFRPVEHNLTSEWDYLYNKAHNEFLNYLATTGIVGFGTYVAIIGVVLFLLFRLIYTWVLEKHPDEKTQDASDHQTLSVIAALFAGYVSILITNFFGFSVVIINVYFFIIPAFLLFLLRKIPHDNAVTFGNAKNGQKEMTTYQWVGLMAVVILCLYLLLTLFRTWQADKAYALGYNLNRYGDFQNAYLKLSEAVKLRPSEPIYRDEFAVTNATIASALYEQQDTANATQFANQAIALTNDVTTNYPNNILFWKNRFKVFYLMAAGNPPEKTLFQNEAIESLKKVISLAPTDAKSLYNLGILYRDSNQPENALRTFEKAVSLKPNYRDAYYALGLAYHALAVDENGRVTDPTNQEKAIETMQHILNTLQANDPDATKSLQEWGVLGASDSAQTPTNP